MLTESRLKIYLNAYRIRIKRGETIESIDESYLSLGRLSKADVTLIHKNLKI